MFRLARFIFIVAVPLAVYFWRVSPTEAAECSRFLWPESTTCDTDSTPTGQTFVSPDAVDDSLFGKRIYARLADNANVYPEPSRGVAPVRNAGDGFLFVTINYWEKINGETWYKINHGEFVHEDDILQLPASDFRGVAITQQPERPFGWIVQDVQPSSRPDGEPNEAFAELPRFAFFEIYDAQVGQDDWIWYEIDDGRWIRQTYASVVDVSPRPDDVGPNDFWTEVDLYEQTFAAYEGDHMVYATLISSGLNRWPTREGLFQVWDRFGEYKMSGAEGQVDYYFLEDVPYIMYFDDLMGIALHGTYWHDRFGYKHSHGCVNMPILDAEWVFNWSVESSTALWVWVHTSDPNDYFGAS